MAKKESLKDKNINQLMDELAKKRDELRNFRFSAAGARPKDSAAPKKTRAEIARIMTELHVRSEEAMNESVETVEATA